MILKNIFFCVLIFFSFIGMILSSNIIHEWIHKKDFEYISKEGYICAFVLPDNLKSLIKSPIAYYSWSYSPSENMNLNLKEMIIHSEWKAYSIEILIIIIYLVSLFFIFYFWVDYIFLEREIDKIFKEEFDK